MKTKEQVLEFIRANGFTPRAMDKICGFLIANNIKGIDENIVYKVGDKDFNFFFNWFTSDLSSHFVLNAALEVYESWAKDLENRILDIKSQIKGAEMRSNKDEVEDPKKENKEDDEAKNAKFKVGDRVEVVDLDQRCTTYIKMFEKMNFKDKVRNYSEFKNGVVFGVSIYNGYNEHIYGVRSDKGEEMLILENGLKKYEYKKGDYVEVVKKGRLWNNDGKMDYLLNRIVRVRSLTGAGFLMESDEKSYYSWNIRFSEVIPSTCEEYKKQCDKDRIKELETELKDLKELKS